MITTIKQGEWVSPNIQIQYQDYDTEKQQALDTVIIISAELTISGEELGKFNEELKALLNKYRI